MALINAATSAFVMLGGGCRDSSQQSDNAQSTNVLVLTEANFKAQVLSVSKTVLVDFWAPWCGPCRTMGPIINEIADDYQGRVIVGKVNVDEAPALAQRYGIQAIPTLLFFNGGRVVDQGLGIISKGELSSRLEKLQSSTPEPASSNSEK